MTRVPIPLPTHADDVALFRASIVGDLVTCELKPGELVAELKLRANRRYRAPGARASRTWHWKTLQRWLADARDGLHALRPASRSRGSALAIAPNVREALLEMRAEHPTAASDLILDEAVRNGLIEEGAVSSATLRRLFAREGLPRVRSDRPTRHKQRRRWEADRVCRIWHADVCHVWLRDAENRPFKAYVHGILDDHSRYVVQLRATAGETENDLLAMLVETLARFPAPDVLYVDNGSTYRGAVLALVGERLGFRVVHPEPRDPEARGKMERFWRTMRQRLVDVAPLGPTLHDANLALTAWLDADYHARAHGGLFGETPKKRFRNGLTALPIPKTLREIAAALAVPRRVKIRKDLTFSVDRAIFEVAGGHFAGASAEVTVDPFSGAVLSVTIGESPAKFSACDPKANARRGRAEASDAPKASSRFDRVTTLLAAAREVTDA